MSELFVLPGYQRMNNAQRSRLLDMRDAGELGRQVAVELVAKRRVRVTDQAGRTWLIDRNGERTPDGPSTGSKPSS